MFAVVYVLLNVPLILEDLTKVYSFFHLYQAYESKENDIRWSRDYHGYVRYTDRLGLG